VNLSSSGFLLKVSGSFWRRWICLRSSDSPSSSSVVNVEASDDNPDVNTEIPEDNVALMSVCSSLVLFSSMTFWVSAASVDVNSVRSCL